MPNALIKCPHCGRIYPVFDINELNSFHISYNCECGNTIDVNFFDFCPECGCNVGFLEPMQASSNNDSGSITSLFTSAFALGGHIATGNIIGAISSGVSIFNSLNGQQTSNGNGVCPGCGSRVLRCPSCNELYSIDGNNPNQEWTCPHCSTEVVPGNREGFGMSHSKAFWSAPDVTKLLESEPEFVEEKPKKPKKKRVNYKTIYEKHINNYIQNTESVSSSIDSIQSFVQATLELASADSNATRKQGYYCALADACIGYVLATEDEQNARECAAYVESALGDLMEQVGMDNVCDQVFAFYCIFCILNQDTNDKESLEQIKSIDELFPLEPLNPISDLPFQVNEIVISTYSALKEDALFAFANAMYENKQYLACQNAINELEKIQTDGAIIWTNVFRSNLFYFGNGVQQDYQKAYEYSKKAAEYYDLNIDIDPSNRAHFGWVTALNALGYCFATGQGTSIDYDLAYKYIKRSAEAGNPDALSSLGEMYMKGLAVPQDTTQARSCFRQALDGGDDSAQEFMDYLNGRTDKMPGLMKCDIAATASKSIPERITVPSSSESEYLAEYKEMLEDYGEIGPRERKQLEKLRVRLGLSESDVQRLESSFSSSSLTADEQEYIEEYKEMLEDYGEITPRERKRLEKLQQRLGLSTGRCVELEKM